MPFLSASPIAFVSLLDYIVTVSLADFLALWLVLFLSARFARACRSREDVLLLLRTLIGVLRKTFLLIYNNHDSFPKYAINNNNINHLCTAYNAFAVAITVAFATGHDHLMLSEGSELVPELVPEQNTIMI